MPNGHPVRETFHRNRGSTVVRLLRNYDATSPTGIFHCEIADASGISQNIFVGLYPEGEGRTICIELTSHSVIIMHILALSDLMTDKAFMQVLYSLKI